MRLPHPKLEALQRAPLFAGVPARRLKKLADVTDLRSFREGELLMRQNYRGEQLLVIVQGEVEVSRGGEVVATVGAGSFVGEVGLLEHADRSATVRANTRLKVLVLGIDAVAHVRTAMPQAFERLRTEADRRRLQAQPSA